MPPCVPSPFLKPPLKVNVELKSQLESRMALKKQKAALILCSEKNCARHLCFLIQLVLRLKELLLRHITSHTSINSFIYTAFKIQLFNFKTLNSRSNYSAPFYGPKKPSKKS